MDRKQKTVALCLAGVAGSLLVVGVESGTLVRHVIQIVPIVLALAAVTRRQPLGPFAALPIFAFWLLVMTLIWLYIAGVPMFFTGNFTSIEIALTVLMGLLCVSGIRACLGLRVPVSVTARILVGVAAGGLQLGAMFISFLDPFVNR